MKIFRLGMVAGLAAALTACPPTDRPADERIADPATEPVVQERTTPGMEIPATAQRVELEAAAGSAVAGEIHVEARERSTGVWLTVRNGVPNESHGVRVMSGTCQNPGVELARIDAVRTDNAGFGQSSTDVGHAPNQIMDGNHIVAVYTPGADAEVDRPVACATLPQAGATRM